MNTVKNTFQKTASRLEVKKTLDSAKKKLNLLEQGLVTGVDSPNKKLKASHSPNKSVKCTKCEKLGHFAKDCWSDLTCAQCGLKGHIEKFCKSDKKPKDKAGKPLSIGEVFSAKLK